MGVITIFNFILLLLSIEIQNSKWSQKILRLKCILITIEINPVLTIEIQKFRLSIELIQLPSIEIKWKIFQLNLSDFLN